MLWWLRIWSQCYFWDIGLQLSQFCTKGSPKQVPTASSHCSIISWCWIPSYDLCTSIVFFYNCLPLSIKLPWFNINSSLLLSPNRIVIIFNDLHFLTSGVVLLHVSLLNLSWRRTWKLHAGCVWPSLHQINSTLVLTTTHVISECFLSHQKTRQKWAHKHVSLFGDFADCWRDLESGPDNSKLNTSKTIPEKVHPVPMLELKPSGFQLISCLQSCYVIQSGINIVLAEALTKLPASSMDASRLCIQGGTSFTWF